MWTTIAQHALDLFIFALILSSTIGAGLRFLSWLRIRCVYPLEALVASAGLGLATFAYGIFFIGIFGLLQRISIILLIVLLLIIAVPSFRAGWRRVAADLLRALPKETVLQVERQSIIERIFTGICIVIILLTLIGALSPPTISEWDSLSYHLAVPKLYLKMQRIYYVPFTSHASFPFTTEMLYTAGLALTGHTLAKLFHWFFFLGCAGWLLCFGNWLAQCAWRMHDDMQRAHLPSPARAGWGAAWALFTVPIVVAEASTAYIDIALAFYTLFAIYAGLRFLETREGAWVLVGGIASGICMGIKYTGILVFAFFTAIALLGWFKTPPRRKPTGVTVLALSLAVIIASPWYVKNIIYTGNPLFPFFYEIFGGRYWNAKMAMQYRAHQKEFGTQRTLRELLLLPWNLTMRSDIPQGLGRTPLFKPIRYEVQPNPSSGPGLIPFAFLPTAAVAIPLPSAAVLTMGVGGIWLLTWFYTIQYLRYLIPCIILLSAVVGYLYAHWVCRNWFTRIAAQITMVSGLLYSSVICLTWTLPCIPVVSGLISEDEYLRATLPAYAIAQYINSYLPRSAKLVTYGEPLCYYFEREYIWGDPGHNLLIDYDAVARSQNPLVALFRAYRKLNVTHVLVNRRFFRFDSDAIPNRLLARAMQIGILKWKVTMGVEELYEISWDVVRHEFNSKGGDSK